MSRNARSRKFKVRKAAAKESAAKEAAQRWRPDPSLVKIPADSESDSDALTGEAPFPFDEPRSGRVRILKDAKANEPRKGGVSDMVGEPHDPDAD